MIITLCVLKLDKSIDCNDEQFMNVEPKLVKLSVLISSEIIVVKLLQLLNVSLRFSSVNPFRLTFCNAEQYLNA